MDRHYLGVFYQLYVKDSYVVELYQERFLDLRIEQIEVTSI